MTPHRTTRGATSGVSRPARLPDEPVHSKNGVTMMSGMPKMVNSTIPACLSSLAMCRLRGSVAHYVSEFKRLSASAHNGS